MKVENQNMKAFLKLHGIDAMPKYIPDGSIKGSWRLYGLLGKTPDGGPIWQPWWDNTELHAKLNGLGFTNLWGEPLSRADGNGGVFSIFVRGNDWLRTQPPEMPAQQTTEPIPYTTRQTRRDIRMARAGKANMRITRRNGRPLYY